MSTTDRSPVARLGERVSSARAEVTERGPCHRARSCVHGAAGDRLRLGRLQRDRLPGGNGPLLGVEVPAALQAPTRQRQQVTSPAQARRFEGVGQRALALPCRGEAEP